MASKEQVDQLHAELERRGEEQVRVDLARGVFDQPWQTSRVEEWLRQKNLEREDEHRDETLKVAREANDISRSAKYWSIGAVLGSIGSFIVALIALLIAAYVAFWK